MAVLAAKPNSPSSISRTHMTEGKNQLAQIILISTHTHHTQQSRCDRPHSPLPQWTLSLSLTSNMQVVKCRARHSLSHCLGIRRCSFICSCAHAYVRTWPGHMKKPEEGIRCPPPFLSTYSFEAGSLPKPRTGIFLARLGASTPQ